MPDDYHKAEDAIRRLVKAAGKYGVDYLQLEHKVVYNCSNGTMKVNRFGFISAFWYLMDHEIITRRMDGRVLHVSDSSNRK